MYVIRRPVRSFHFRWLYRKSFRTLPFGKLLMHYNSILLHSGLNPAWYFWFSTRFSCCLKMKLVENILGYIWEQIYRFSRGCKPWDNLWNCSRKYPKIFKTYFIFRQQKIEFKPMSGVIMLLKGLFSMVSHWLMQILHLFEFGPAS